MNRIQIKPSSEDKDIDNGRNIQNIKIKYTINFIKYGNLKY